MYPGSASRSKDVLPSDMGVDERELTENNDHIDLAMLTNFLKICPLTTPDNLNNCLEKRREKKAFILV